MTEDEWSTGWIRSVEMRLASDAIEETDEHGRPIVGETLLVLLNAHHEPITFTLPAHRRGVRWEPVLNTFEAKKAAQVKILKGGASYELEARSLAVLRLRSNVKR